VREKQFAAMKIAPGSSSLSAHPDRIEYLVETYARDVGWAKMAKEIYGHSCMLDRCGNTFRKNDGSYYIEVHHIIPLHKNGEDAIWNLSVLCAHHHKMAHYADDRTRMRIQSELQKMAESACV
jgi:predicted HNH restriction endonuclease